MCAADPKDQTVLESGWTFLSLSINVPVLRPVSSYTAEPANWGLTPKEVGGAAGVGEALGEDCLRSLSSPAPPAGAQPSSGPLPRRAWFSLPPWLTLPRERATPLHLLLTLPKTAKRPNAENTLSTASVKYRKDVDSQIWLIFLRRFDWFLTNLSCVSPAVTPLFQCSVGFLQFLFETRRLGTGARGQKGGGCTGRTLAWRKMLPNIGAHAI